MYSVGKVAAWNINGLSKVCRILFACGKDMADRFDLYHWDNSLIKVWAIVILCVLKNRIWLVSNDGKPVATFQTKQVGDALLFQKLATDPSCAGAGIGSFCLSKIEEIGKAQGCKEILCEVYDKSNHALTFYMHRGYCEYGETRSLKYTERKLKKTI